VIANVGKSADWRVIRNCVSDKSNALPEVIPRDPAQHGGSALFAGIQGKIRVPDDGMGQVLLRSGANPEINPAPGVSAHWAKNARAPQGPHVGRTGPRVRLCAQGIWPTPAQPCPGRIW
jgi:hypothetical protein